MKTIGINLYRFYELSLEARSKARTEIPDNGIHYYTADGKLATDLENQNVFLNSFVSWYETHHEIVSAINYDLSRGNTTPKTKAVKISESQGTHGLYELAEELTWKFEELHQGREWNGEFFDEIEAFLTTELKPE